MAISVYWNDNGVPVPFPIGEGSDGTIKTTTITSVDRSEVLTVGTAFTVPEYTVGSNNLQVFVNGLLCVKDAQYTEVSSTTIAFTFDVETSAEITAMVTIGSSYEGVLTQRVLVSESRESELVAGTAFSVPEHQVGYGRLKVYLDGLILQENLDYSEVNSSSIVFNFNVPADMQIYVQAAAFM